MVPRYGDSNPVNTWAVANFRLVVDWVHASPERTMVLFGARHHLLDLVLGPRHQAWTGGSENHRHSVWRLDADGVAVWLLNSKRGTTYEIEHPGNPWDGSIPETDILAVRDLLARVYFMLEDAEPVRKYGPIVDPQSDPVLVRARERVVRGEAARAEPDGGPAP